MYDVNGTSVEMGNPYAAPADGLGISFEPIDLLPATNVLGARLHFTPYGSLANPDGSLSKDVEVVVDGDAGVDAVVLRKGLHPKSAEMTLGTSGDFSKYPVDDYASSVEVSAAIITLGQAGEVLSRDVVPVAVGVSGGLGGWEMDSTIETAEPASVAVMDLDFKRETDSLIFTMFLLVLMAVLTLMALIVALMTFTHRRRIEVDLLGWFAGLLFALPFLRTTDPGAPPIGAAIDIYVFLWLILTAMVAAILVTIGWLRQNRHELLKEAAEEGAANSAAD